MKITGIVEESVRSAEEIAQRAIALACVYGLSAEISREDLVDWLKTESMWVALSPKEIDLLTTNSLTSEQMINASWRSESLLILLWSIGLVEDLPHPNEQCDPEPYINLIPPFTSDLSSSPFIASATLRPIKELLNMAQQCLHFHWEVREATIAGAHSTRSLDPGVIRERHYAINWVTGYDGLEWDDVSTDT